MTAELTPQDQVLNALESWAERNNIKDVKGVLKKSGRVQDPHKLYGQFMTEVMVHLPQIAPPSVAEFSECIQSCTAPDLDEFGEFEFKIPTVDSVAEFVPASIKNLGLTVSALGDEITDKNGKNISLTDLEMLLSCQAHLYNEESKVGGQMVRNTMPTQAVKDFLRKEIHQKSGNHWLDLREDLYFRPSMAGHPDVMLGGIIKAFTFAGDNELNLAVLKQWVWQTKRFFFGLPVTDPLMLNLYAHTGGGGKTQIVKKLVQPLEDYMATSTLDTILDPREHGLFTDRYVVFFDELSLGKLEYGQIGPLMAGLKKLITEDKITQRNMRENSHSKKKRIFSPIATSNQPLAQMLPDDSGMRRFFEIEMKAEPNTKRVEQLRAMACLHIWQGIDENLERGYILPGTAIQKKLVEHQGNLKHRSILDDCLEHMDETPILKDSEMGRKIVAINASKVTIAEAVEQVENLGLVAYKALEYRKQLRDWTEENMDKFVAKYLPGIQKLPHDLESRGYITLKIGKNSPYVLIQDTVGGGHV